MSHQPPTPPTADEAKRKIFQDLELANVVHQAQLKHQWTLAQAQDGDHYYRDFLWLFWNHVYNQLPQVNYLTPEADEVWHYHLLNTRKYHADCNMLFAGQYLHHTPLQPNTPPDPAAENAARHAYQQLCNDSPNQLVRQCMW